MIVLAQPINVLLCGCDRDALEVINECLLVIEEGAPLDINILTLKDSLFGEIEDSKFQVVVCDVWHCNAIEIEVLRKFRRENKDLPIIALAFKEEMVLLNNLDNVLVMDKGIPASELFTKLRGLIESIVKDRVFKTK